MPGAADLYAVGSAVKATEIALQETVQHVAGKRSRCMPLLLDTTTMQLIVVDVQAGITDVAWKKQKPRVSFYWDKLFVDTLRGWLSVSLWIDSKRFYVQDQRFYLCVI